MSPVAAVDRFACVGDVEAAMRGVRRLRWEIRGEDAVLCGDLGSARVEVIPVGPHCCELRMKVDVSALGQLTSALGGSRRRVAGPALVLTT